MLTVGRLFTGAETVTVMEALFVLPPESVTDAVIVCVPLVNVREKLPPVPIVPSRLEVQTSFAVRSPSSGSDAEPEKETAVLAVNTALFAGFVICTVGGALAGGGGGGGAGKVTEAELLAEE